MVMNRHVWDRMTMRIGKVMLAYKVCTSIVPYFFNDTMLP